ncbi:MAG: tRNA pseudouridine(54/55) synthase Pus10, partial [Candidatus Aenigmarchaeota archaeon]|nr:tRNA pseudouridine(54/55) synthase Pus10 [Candidatus Aenigmarchaeota archaeon]
MREKKASIFLGLKKVLNNYYLCDKCLGRLVAQLLTNMSNEERGRIIRNFFGMLFDASDIEIKEENLLEVKLRFKKVKISNFQRLCYICNNLLEDEKLKEIANKVIEKTTSIEFNTFLIGTTLPEEIRKKEEDIWEIFGAEFAESIKGEINREIGKIVGKKLRKKLDRKDPDLTIIIDLKNNQIRRQIKSLFVFGYYQKLARGLPQSTWYCQSCKGKGCVRCKGTGKLYPTSIQEIIEKPLLKATNGKKTRFHGSGREDVDARCLGWRPFVIEIVKPLKRKINLRKIQKEINKSKKVKVKSLKFVDKEVVRLVKTERSEKTYLAYVTFEKEVPKEKLRELKKLEGRVIYQKTPLRVIHRRVNKIRKRRVLKISWKVIGKRKVAFKIRTESGLYVKELINGDKGRTKPSFYEILGVKPKKILLDV